MVFIRVKSKRQAVIVLVLVFIAMETAGLL